MLNRYWKLAVASTLAVAVTATSTNGAFAQRAGGGGARNLPGFIPNTPNAYGGTLYQYNTPNQNANNGTANNPNTNNGAMNNGQYSTFGYAPSASGLNNNFSPLSYNEPGSFLPGFPNANGYFPNARPSGYYQGYPLTANGYQPYPLTANYQGYPQTGTGYLGSPMTPNNASLYSPRFNSFTGGFALGGSGYPYSGYPNTGGMNSQNLYPNFGQVMQQTFPNISSTPSDTSASLRVVIPDFAQLFIDDKEVKVDGNEYVLSKDKLPSDHAQVVLVKATWKHGSDTIEKKDRVALIPGDHKSIMILPNPVPTENSRPSSEK